MSNNKSVLNNNVLVDNVLFEQNFSRVKESIQFIKSSLEELDASGKYVWTFSLLFNFDYKYYDFVSKLRDIELIVLLDEGLINAKISNIASMEFDIDTATFDISEHGTITIKMVKTQ